MAKTTGLPKEEKRYILDRIYQIESQLLAQAGKAYKLPNKVITLQEAINLVKKGTVKVRNKSSLTRQFGSSSLCEIFNFDKYHKPLNRFGSQIDQTKFGKAKIKITAESTRLRDEVMLGDCKEAMKLLASFAKMKF